LVGGCFPILRFSVDVFRDCYQIYVENISYRGCRVFSVCQWLLTLTFQYQIWGGIRTYSRDYSDQILIATQDFTENFPDPRAGIIVTVEFVADSLDEFWAIFFFYNGPILPTGVFDKFLSIPSTTDTTQQQKYSELVRMCMTRTAYELPC
jgi:hypothetical protein